MQDGKKMGRRETRPKKWGDEMQDKKNRDTQQRWFSRQSPLQ